jgi:Asp-tRNA(Asn)/Glu-tRNA(Gln) amidotransferase A subunit family amidase
VLDVFEQVDVLITPTVPHPAPAFSELEEGNIGLTLLRNTSPFNAYGLPTISVPVALTSDGLPIGCRSRVARSRSPA